ncbi:hypothetical protein [Shewanella frigidimarina]|uniref:hypothetical protein n=1 Tax=Shewanella frigidimarina TaxID=56812 RepID=UPI003D7B9265
MSEDFTEFELASIHFYSNSEFKNKVTVTSGTVDVMASPDHIAFFSVNNGLFNAADADTSDWQRPNAYGLMVRARLTLANIAVSVTHFKALIWRK